LDQAERLEGMLVEDIVVVGVGRLQVRIPGADAVAAVVQREVRRQVAEIRPREAASIRHPQV
jgi:hypothetical protein